MHTRPVVIVTGASGGIGEVTARFFAAQGWAVVLAARSADRLAAVAADIRAAGGTALAVPTDVTLPADRERLVARTVDAFGRIDALVNNAGLGMAGTLATLDVADLEYVFRVNAFAPVALMQAVLPVMKQGRGPFPRLRRPPWRVIVNVSSIAEELPAPYVAGYGASKAALGYFTAAASVELARDHIAVVKVMPGLTESGFDRHLLTSGTGLSLEQLLAKANLLSPVPAERVAEAVWMAVQTRQDQRYLTFRDWLLCRFARIAPRLTSTLLKAAVKRYVLPSGEPSAENVARDARRIGWGAGGVLAAVAAIAGGVWLWLRGRASARS